MRFKLLLITLLVSCIGWGQIITFEFYSLAGSETSANSNTNHINLAQSSISRGSGLTSAGNSERFNATSWATTSIANAVSGNDYMEFSITPNSGYQFNVSSIVVQWQRSNTGNSAISIRSSLDGYSSDLGGVKTVTDNANTQSFTWTFAQLNSTSSVTYRLYSYAEAVGGTGGPGDGTGNDIEVFGVVSLITPTSTTYTNPNTWSNSAPTSTIDAIINGNLTTTADLACKDLTINSGKTLTIGAGKKLSVSGNLINNGSIVFKSDANATAMFDVFNGTVTGTGTATVERYVRLGKRAFRLFSPSVTTTNFISNNWQLATHITGATTSVNGFDVTSTGNPSMFTFNNQVTSGSGWNAISNTDATNLTAGTGYRVLVRGDRTVDLTVASQDSMNFATTLSATGTLKTGTIVLNASSTPAINNTTNSTTADYSLVGNPYVSAIDWNLVGKSGIDATYYAWDPNMGTSTQRGRYVTFNGTTNDNNLSFVGQFIQPGQAFFVKNTISGTAGTLTFQESNKVSTSANVFRNTNSSATTNFSELEVSLFAPSELALGGYPIDAIKAIFSPNFQNEIGGEDASKLESPGENLAWYRNNTKLAIDAAALIQVSDELLIKTLRLKANTNYTFKVHSANLDVNITAYLVDTYLSTQTILDWTQSNLATFATTNDAASYNENRFKIVFQNAALSNPEFATTIVMYPNPSKNGSGFVLQGVSPKSSVVLYTTLGQSIAVSTSEYETGLQVTPKTPISTGVYIVSITTEGKTSQVKWIVE